MVRRKVTNELLSQTTLTAISFIGAGDWTTTTHPRQQTHILSVRNHDTSRHNNTPMIHVFPLSHAFNFHVSHLYVFLSSLWLTWLADPALVTSVYPNRMQYTPCVLQEASLLDGVDASVRGNGRRFNKTSSYPPCCCYALASFYPYFPTMSSSPLFLLIHSFSRPTLPPLYIINHSHTPCCLCLFIVSLPPYYDGEHFLFTAEQCS